jgi:peptidoglycan/xylan/chitin deacetylase (PgdA/CDA1 family)
MIGVIADSGEHDVVREFFELFKTPWEFYRADQRYEVLLCAADHKLEATAKLVIIYAGRKTKFDDERQIQTAHENKSPCTLSYPGARIPIYGESVAFPSQANCLLTKQGTGECAGYLIEVNGRVLARIGYDLFAEICTLLTAGQPSANAMTPALELHIALLRNLIAGCGVSLVEIPPVPEGFRFIACLTHDVDHPSIRQHKWDHTMFGFLYRAIFGSLGRLIRGQMTAKELLRNWGAAVKLPFVHMQVAKDFWRDFDERYPELEKGVPSTFFVIPFKNQPGRNSHGPAPKFRAARYDAADITDAIRKLMIAGCEVGLHGIDAWLDSSSGQKELEKIRMLTGASETGVRMHWLYYDQQSPATLEAAGAAYDSTSGYNETVGYRAGTTQVYKPLTVNRLLELPLHVMDTALFYRGYLNLSPRRAGTLCTKMIDDAIEFGGALTVNWHDRSLAPERLWGASYRDLILELKDRGAWFATAGQAVAWFRKRRSATFVTDPVDPYAVRVKVAPGGGNSLPGLRLRIHKAGQRGALATHRPNRYVDVAVEETNSASVASEVSR